MSDDTPDTGWRASLALIGLATAILIAGFILVLTTNRTDRAVTTTTVPPVTATTPVTTTAPVTTTPTATIAPITTTAPATTTIADPRRRTGSDAGISARLVVIQATSTDGRVCATFPGAIIDQRGYVLSTAGEPAGCTGADYVVKMAVGGGSNQLDVPYRASLAGRDVRRGVSVLRIDRDITGTWLPVPRLASATVATTAPPASLMMSTIFTADGSSVVGQAVTVTVSNEALTPAPPAAADGAILHDAAGTIIGFVSVVPGSRPIWVNDVSDLIKAASAI